MTLPDKRAARTKKLSYGFMAAGVLFGVITVLMQERGADPKTPAAAFALFLGLYAFARALSGLQAGQIHVRTSTAGRGERPIVFWFVVGTLATAGLTLAIAGVLMFFGVF